MKKIITIFVLSIVTVLSNGCVVVRKEAQKVEKPHIVYSVESMPKDLLTMSRRDGNNNDILPAIFEGLVSMDKYGEVVPAIAESWDISKDKLQYKFYIREDAAWSDGSPISASDFVAFFSNILSKRSGNVYSEQLSCIYGVQEYHNGSAGFSKVAIRAEDEKSLIIRLNYPYDNLLSTLAMPLYSLRGESNALKHWSLNYKKIRYSGGFQIADIKADNSVILEKNEYYWNKDNVTDSKFMIIERESKESALAEYETSLIDIITNPPISEVSRLMNSENTLVVNTPNKIGVEFNFSVRSIASDINFRKSIAKALNPEHIAEVALNEFTIEGGGLYEESINVFKDNAVENNISIYEAKEYLSKISQENLKNIKLIALNTDKNKRISKALEEALKSDLGISVKSKLLNGLELENCIESLDYDILLTDFVADFHNDISLLNYWNSKSDENIIKYFNPDYDSAIAKARSESDTNKRENYIKQCNDIIKQDIPVIFLFNDIRLISKSPDISGLDVDILGNIDLKSIYR
jgi:oligopeptide transport system substrate-binding protein